MKLGNKVQRLRGIQELTQTQLAEKAGVTQAYVARIESDRVKNPKASGLSGLAKALGVPLEVLLDEEISIEAWQNEEPGLRIDKGGRQLVRAYRILRAREKKLLLDFAQLLRHHK